MSRRVAIGNLVESMDFMDATRSSESMPRIRLRRRRINWLGVAGWLLVALVAFTTVAAFAH